MTKQEEIKEGVAKELLEVYGTVAHQGRVSSQELHATERVLSYLHSQGVVIKVGDKQVLPDRVYFNEDNKDIELELSGHTQTVMLQAKFMQVEPLIEICEHEWVNANNKVLMGAEICVKCHAVRATEPLIKE